jgi:hypothetical protein
MANWSAPSVASPTPAMTAPANASEASRAAPGSTRAIRSRTLAPNQTRRIAAHASMAAEIICSESLSL